MVGMAPAIFAVKSLRHWVGRMGVMVAEVERLSRSHHQYEHAD